MSSKAAPLPLNRDFESPPGRRLIIVASVSAGLATIAVLLRLNARRKNRISYGLDDVFICLALVCGWANAVLDIHGCTSFGLGIHANELPYANIQMILHGLFAWDLAYGFCCLFWKLSIIYFYRRIFSIHRQSKIILIGIEAFVIIWAAARLLTYIFQCTPITHFWNPLSEGTCVNKVALYYSFQVVNIVADVFLFVFPIPLVWTLQMSFPERLGMCIIFLSGAILIGFASARCAAIHLLVEPDFTYEAATTGVWAILEIQFGIICVCLPTLSNYFRGCGTRISSTFAKSSFRSSSGKDSVKQTSNPADQKGPETWAGRPKYRADIDTGISTLNEDDRVSLEKGFGEGHIKVQRHLAIREEVHNSN